MRGRQEELEKYKSLLSKIKNKTDYSVIIILQNGFIIAAEEGDIEIIHFLLNNDFTPSPDTLKRTLKGALEYNQIHVIRYLINNNKIKFPYDYLADVIGRVMYKKTFMQWTIVALCSLEDLDDAESRLEIYSRGKENCTDMDSQDLVEGQAFFRRNLNNPQEILKIKIYHIMRETNGTINDWISIISKFVPKAKEILETIRDCSKQLLDCNVVTGGDLDLLTEISRLLFNIDPEKLQSLKVETKNSIFPKEVFSIIQEYVGSKELIDIFKKLEQRAADLKNRVGFIHKFPPNPVESRNAIYGRTQFLFRLNPPPERSIFEKLIEIFK